MALLVGAALLGAHFLMAAISQAPFNPVKMRLQDETSSYLNPYFAQNWQLFAPDPLSDDRGILARAKCADGSTSEYYDVTTSHIRAVQQDRFFPSRVSRLVTSNLQLVNDQDPILDRLRSAEEKKRKPAVPLMDYEKKSRDDAIQFLSRYALSQAPQACDGKIQALQVRMYVHKMPQWSERHDPPRKANVTVQDFRWVSLRELR
ncbi:DUF5819 family protein [Streptomyces niveiscabiei]|uniref:DUF5819 family protein n=1 Tax=Streptomyces niveiscabiei TaxID=164115 RepID=UPI0029AAE1FD|nr:DUF5819 family protein [Streptomyces niveiscabiei]MDX3388188.1 DUF5819 family protein [Streptomyces niveiscabiei]